nr:reverse transcriptase domain-containing protein [Tanacetum cinerariifolium]
MDENVTYKKAILRRCGKSIDGSCGDVSSSKSVGDSSLYSDKLQELLVNGGSGLVDDVAVEAVTSSTAVENRLVDDVVVDKDGGSKEYVNEHTKFSSAGCIQKDANLLDICSDLRYVEGQEYRNKGCKVATCDDLLHTNVKQGGNLEKETTCFAHMSSRTRNESSVSRRIKDTRNMEILTYSLEVGSVKESTRLSDIFVLKLDESDDERLDESDDERVTGNGLETKVIETSLGVNYLENVLVATSRLLEEWHGHYTTVTWFVISMDVSHLNYDNKDGCVRVWHLYEYCVGHNNISMNLILPEVCWKCEVVNENLNPISNQTFDFVVEDGSHDMLMAEVWDHDTFGKLRLERVETPRQNHNEPENEDSDEEYNPFHVSRGSESSDEEAQYQNNNRRNNHSQRDAPMRVKIVAIKLKKHASVWWEQLKLKRAHENKPRIRTWEKMKRELRKKFLPDGYLQEAFLHLHDFAQRDLSVAHYTQEFDHLMLKCGIVEPEEQTIARYLRGIRKDIHDVVNLQPFISYSDVYKLATKVEKQIKEKEGR